MALLLTKVDALLGADHYHLTSEDECFVLREYTPRAGFSYSETNNLISNLKKSPERRGKPEWFYKEQAVRQLGQELRQATNPKWLLDATIVPMPPSKTKGHPLYDDRIVQIARILCDGTGAQMRELLYQDVDTEAHHQQDNRRDVTRLMNILKVDESVASPPPRQIGILDDMLTTGAHFRAGKHVLLQRFPGVRVLGLFLARRVIVNEDTTDSLIPGSGS